MSISPVRAFALGACSVIALAGSFTAGIVIGGVPFGTTTEYFGADGQPLGVACTVDCPAPPGVTRAKKITCPAAPGFTATAAANERADNCAAAKSVQDLLLSTGAIGANVHVSQEENASLLGPEKTTRVVAQVFLPPSMEHTWNAEAAAHAVAGTVGTRIDRVFIGDDKLLALFDGRLAARAKGNTSASSAPGPRRGEIGLVPVPHAQRRAPGR